MGGLRWITAYLVLPSKSFESSSSFWQAVTGFELSSARGERGDIATLVPRVGDPYLMVQRIDVGRGGIYLDMHTDDLDDFVQHASACGADILQSGDQYVVMASPGQFMFSVVGNATDHSRPSPMTWPGGESTVDQVCLDIPGMLYDRETDFWAALTGWEHDSGLLPEFGHLARPKEQPLRLLLQEVEADVGAVGSHLDLASTDRAAEVERHVSLGAEQVRETEYWTTLRDPAGHEYCVTDRDPTTGTLPPVS